MKPCVFLDRDGTINEEIGYLHDPDKLVLIPGSAQAIKRLNDLGWIVVCITNQSGVARGYYPVEAVAKVHNRLEELLAAENAYIDKIYFCPHHPTEGRLPYLKDCRCRKPGLEMLEKAVDELDIDLSISYLVGDSLIDIQTAKNAGIKAVLVLTGYGRMELENLTNTENEEKRRPDYICKDLFTAVDWIIGQQKLKFKKVESTKKAPGQIR